MKNNKDDDNFYSGKTNSSSKGENGDMLQKIRPRCGVKSNKVNNNNFQSGRHTVAVPLTNFSGISHNASFQSKLLFFNGGKTRPKFQHIPVNHDKVISEENDKIDIKLKKIGSIKDDKNKKVKNDKDDLDSNININKIVESKNANTNKNNDTENKKPKNYVKKNSISYNSSQLHSLTLDSKTPPFTKSPGNNEKKVEEKKPVSNFKLKSLKDQWDFQKILLDYNILDFTSKFKLFFIYF